MFGYVLPVRSAMPDDVFERYRALYCGTCKQLGKRFGLFSRFLLNYDLVLLAVVTDALSGEEGLMRQEGCFANPFKRRNILHGTHGLQLAADGLILLSWHQLLDHLTDEEGAKQAAYRLAKPFLRHMYRKAAAQHPEADRILHQQMQHQYTLENAGCTCIDEACEPTAKMCEALFSMASSDAGQQKILGRLGLFAGQIVYLLDAAEDYAEDAEQGRFNVFINQGLTKNEAIEAAKRRCQMAAREIALCYNLLPIRQYRAILDNIFFLGLPQGIANAGIKRTLKNKRQRPILHTR